MYSFLIRILIVAQIGLIVQGAEWDDLKGRALCSSMLLQTDL